MAEKTTKKGKAAPVKKAAPAKKAVKATVKKLMKKIVPKPVKPAKDLQALRSVAAKKAVKPTAKAVKTTPKTVPKPATDLQGVRSAAAKKPVKAPKKVQPAAKPKPKKAKRAPKAKGPRKLGFNIPLPTSEPEEYDAHCPFFGKMSIHGRILKGTVVSAKMYRTVKVEINRKHYVRKYERYEKRRTRLLVHNPPSVNAKVGDIVRIMETRPISKTKHFVVVERIPPKVPAVTETEEKKD